MNGNVQKQWPETARDPRRQPDPLRPLERALRRSVQPGHAHRRARRARRALRAPGRARSARSSPAPCSSTAATSTSRASACSARALDHATPAYDVQQACDTGLQAALAVANKIALGPDRLRASPAASTPPATPRSASTRTCASVLLRGQPAQERRRAGEAARPPAPGPHRPRASRATPSRAPACRWASTGDHDRARGASRARRRTSSPRRATSGLAAAYERGFFDDLVTPYLGLERDQNLRPDSSAEKLAKLKPVFGEGETRR